MINSISPVSHAMKIKILNSISQNAQSNSRHFRQNGLILKTFCNNIPLVDNKTNIVLIDNLDVRLAFSSFMLLIIAYSPSHGTLFYNYDIIIENITNYTGWL